MTCTLPPVVVVSGNTLGNPQEKVSAVAEAFSIWQLFVILFEYSMNRRTLIAFSILSGLALSIAQYVAIAQSLYFIYWWFDIPMHIFGGLTLALAVTTFIELAGSFFQSTFFKKGWNVVIIVFLMGIVWEIFEVLLDVSYIHLGFDAVDTLADICNDVIGASILAWLTVRDRY